ncbi:MAG TPA: Holliday junction resolvase RuvX [Alphaproteobacteria bacterium]|nr:Holliday junction resolvase RuvX [Alphaproteobacteria bacterium]
MNVFERHDLIRRRPEVPTGKALMGIDHGSKTLGIAVSDSLWMTSTPLGTVGRKKFSKDIQEIKLMLQGREIGAVILGLPREMDGGLGPRAQSVADYASSLEEFWQLPCLLWEERLTSAEAERAMLKADLSRARRSQLIDSHAAAIILQSALDRLSNP